ncbi:uncharacterized protein PRCAT00001348001 [Priceomyces carsonii]|uniref:uncharacterized protein n=1 Tax=Priceomyces carsonii TaxID=28549 RepID=UPI002EDB6214|nr:unnamed protein product [Priceomyces carsonii]
METANGSISPEYISYLEHADPGTIKIDCSGAFIANGDILRDQYESPAASDSPSPEISSESDAEEENSNGLYLGENLEDVKALSVADDNVELARNEDYDISKNINLPKHNSEVIHISVDIGGTLTKLVYFTKSKVISGGGRLHFRDFQTGNFADEVLEFMIKLIQKSIHKRSYPPITYIMATGGGAHKFYLLMKDTFSKYKLPMKIIAKDEMECLIRGLDWLITKIPHEIFTYDLKENNTRFIPNRKDENIYPYLLVNIGSGVSMIKVVRPGPGGFERIGGSSLGGGTLWGLLSLLTEAEDYNEMLEMAQRGDNENIDLLVGDIYGSNYNKIGLKSSHIASSFAKVFKRLRFSKSKKKLTPAEKLAQFKQEDMARSLLYLISNNIGQIAYLQAVRFDLKRIYFGGSYISGHKQTIHTLSYAVNFWSNGDMQSYFLRHEGYLGSVGAFIMGPNSESIKNAAQPRLSSIKS